MRTALLLVSPVPFRVKEGATGDDKNIVSESEYTIKKSDLVVDLL